MISSFKLMIAGLVVSNLVFIGLYSFDHPATPEPMRVENKLLMPETTTLTDDAPLRALQQKVADLEQTLLKERGQHQAAIQQWQQAQTNAVPVKTTAVNNTAAIPHGRPPSQNNAVPVRNTSVNDTNAVIDSYLNERRLDKDGKPLLIGNALQKWHENIEAALVNRIVSETSPENLLQLAQQLKSLHTIERLDGETGRKLLQYTGYLNTDQQGEMLASLEDKVTVDVLPDLEPLLYSNDQDVSEEAFLRLEEMGVNPSTKANFEYLAVNSQSEWVRDKAKQMTSKTQ